MKTFIFLKKLEKKKFVNNYAVISHLELRKISTNKVNFVVVVVVEKAGEKLHVFATLN